MLRDGIANVCAYFCVTQTVPINNVMNDPPLADLPINEIMEMDSTYTFNPLASNKFDLFH